MASPSQAQIDSRWMRAALALAQRGVGLTTPNPSVGCILVRDGKVIGRGWTQAGGRPHAEAVALAPAGEAARGATAYLTLEPCAHQSPRGPSCAEGLIAAGIARLVCASRDPDPRTAGQGFARLRAAGIEVVDGVREAEARMVNPGFFLRHSDKRPAVTLKLATSLDGRLALADGSSRWITGEAARAHAHLERARHDAIITGWRTVEVDDPALDVRLAGLSERSLVPVIQSRMAKPLPPGSRLAQNPRSRSFAGSPAQLVAQLGGEGMLALLVESGPRLAQIWLEADLVDRLLWYRAPILLGSGAGLPCALVQSLDQSHGRWTACDSLALGVDRLDVYVRNRKDQNEQ